MSYAPDTWYDSLEPHSVATCVVQRSAALTVFLALNRFPSRHTLGC